MSLSIGTRVGPYEITGTLGAGGMGEVYRARDPRLNRDVALKVLPESFAADPERLARFQREAQVLAALKHPNIGVIYGLEEAGGTHALVLELIDGDTLADQISRSPLPLEQALQIGTQIADALEAAHEQGIIHRDLKPSNIKVTPDGVVKVLDFGLAKLAGPNEADPHNRSPTSPAPLAAVSQSPTLSMPAVTGIGVILGTAAYMSPEQAKGRIADKRSDVWAFGCVLYEMLTGRRAFEGDDLSEVLAAVIKGEPDWNALPAATPPAIRRLLRRCLQKDRRERLHDIGDARLDIKDASTVPAGELPKSKNKYRERVAWTVAAASAAVALSLVLFYMRGRAVEDAPAVRFTVPPPADTSFGTIAAAPFPSISPNGRLIAFVASRPGISSASLWVRSLESLEARELSGTDGASLPFWSPDSRSIGFASQNRLQRIQISGGPPQTVCNLTAGVGLEGGTWNGDGIIVFAGGRGPLMRVPASGGSAIPATALDKSKNETTHRDPYFLPDNRHFLYLAQNSVFVGSLDGSVSKRLVVSDSKAVYAPPGYMLFISQSTLLAQAFDVRRLELTGEPFPIAENVRISPFNGQSAFSVSETGVLVYRTGEVNATGQLSWFDRNGKSLGLMGMRGPITQLSLSPDDTRVAISRRVPGPLEDLWVLDIATKALSRQTFDPAQELDPIWTPDGKAITFNRGGAGQADIFLKVIGENSETLLSDAPGSKGPDDWSRDGKFLLYQSRPAIFALPATGDRKPFKLADIPGYVDEPHFSPDGAWVAYSSDESGQNEIYVASFPAFEGKRQLSVGGGAQPRWRSDGKELFYLAPDRKLMSVDITAGSALDSTPPKALFQTSVPNPTQDQYDVTRDGLRFLVVTGSTESPDSPLTVVLNWAAGLKR